MFRTHETHLETQFLEQFSEYASRNAYNNFRNEFSEIPPREMGFGKSFSNMGNIFQKTLSRIDSVKYFLSFSSSSATVVRY